MADISAFPDYGDLTSDDTSIILTESGPAKRFLLAADATVGQVLIYSGAAGSVEPAAGSLTEKVAGVAAEDGSTGDYILVWLPGNIVKLTNASTSVAITQGSWLVTDDNAVKGTVSAADFTEGATATVYVNVVGQAIEAIAASSYGYVYICTNPITVPPS